MEQHMSVVAQVAEVAVTRANGHGFKANGQWLNFSKYADPAPTRPRASIRARRRFPPPTF
jgi:hypothetical protein